MNFSGKTEPSEECFVEEKKKGCLFRFGVIGSVFYFIFFKRENLDRDAFTAKTGSEFCALHLYLH